MTRYLKPLVMIIKKELKSYFDHPTAYIILIILVAVNSFFFFRSVFLYNIADLRPMFNVFSWILLFIVPAITMRLLAEEKQNQTLELILTQPIYEWQVLAGKFISSLLFIIIGLLLTLPIPFSLAAYGEFEIGVILVQYLGLIMLASAMIAMGLFASSLTKNQIVSFLLSVVLIFILLIIGFDLVLASLPAFLKNIFGQLSLSWHYQNVIRGVIDLRDVIYFFTTAASFLAASYWFILRGQVNSKRALWRQLKIGIVVLISMAVVVNILGLNIHGRLDLTKQKLYTLSSATRDIIRQLPDLVTIDFYRSGELPPEISVRARDITDLLFDYEIESAGRLKVVDHQVSDENEEKAQQAGIQPVQFNILKADEFQVKKGYFGLVISYLDEKEVIPFIESSDDFEYRVTSLIRKMTVDIRSKVGFLSGHEEKSPYADYTTWFEELEKQYEVFTVTIDEETGQLSQEPDILVIAGPKAEVTEAEKEVLRSYIHNNGKVLFLIDPVEVNLQTLQATVNEYSLADLVEELGVRVNTDIVADLRSHESITFGGGMFSYILPYPFWPRVVAAENNPITGDIKTVVLPWPSSLSATDKTAEVITLLTTSQAGFSQVGNFYLMPDQNFNVSQNEISQKVLALAIIGKEAEEENDNRSIVVGDSDFLTENFVRSNKQSLVFALNAVDWLAQDSQLITVRSKQRQLSPLVFESDRQKNKVKYINQLVVPLAIAFFGGLYLYRRRRLTKRKYSS